VQSPARKRPFEWLAELPTTQLRICVTLSVIVATAIRYLIVPDPPSELGAWLGFLAGLAGIDTATVIGKRFTSDPAVITAEASARQDPPPTTNVDASGAIEVIPQPGAQQFAVDSSP